MKQHALYIAFLLLFTLSATVVSAQQEFTVPLSRPGQTGKVEVDIKKGPVQVKGTARQDILVRYQNLEDGELRLEESQNGLKKITGGVAGLEVVEKDNQVFIESESWNKGLSIYVEVPQRMNLELQSYNNGDIKVENVEGEIVVETYNGSITAENIGGSLVANTYNGPIVATFTRLAGDKPMAFTTYNGKVDLTLPAAAKASFKMKSDMGEIFTGFDMALTAPQVKNGSSREGARKTFVDNWITGAVNGGGPEVTVKTYHGDIYIRKK